MNIIISSKEGGAPAVASIAIEAKPIQLASFDGRGIIIKILLMVLYLFLLALYMWTK
ncbi:MAG: hypothetical protein IH819_06460 [Bacteroidetes bacterium]|nr:hypothetical protein [Bacteroidota bacterium]